MCETNFEADLPEEIDLDAEPWRIDQILDGSFFSITCPSCGSTIKPELDVGLVSRKNGISIKVLPEIERLSFCLGQTSISKGTEVLIGYEELVERAQILSDKLDAATIEIIKYYLLLKAEESASDALIPSVSYANLQASKAPQTENKLLFHIKGIKPDEVAVLPIAQSYYERILKDKAVIIKQDPFNRVFKGPYKSIHVLEMSD
jgi:hypothetical protein